jgi:hypothetical protein
MPVVDPDPKRLPEILKSIPADTPIVMLNLLRFRNKARYKDGEADYDPTTTAARPTAATHWWRSRRSKAWAARCCGPATPWPA